MTNNFLNKLKKENKLELVEYSNEIRDSYLDKSDSCYKSAKILLENNLLENSIGLSYYSMYDALLSLLFGVGIKCENHSGSILMLKLLFEENELFEIISNAKKVDEVFSKDIPKLFGVGNDSINRGASKFDEAVTKAFPEEPKYIK